MRGLLVIVHFCVLLVVPYLVSDLLFCWFVSVGCSFSAWVIVQILGLYFYVTVLSLRLLLFFYFLIVLLVSICGALFFEVLFNATFVTFRSATFVIIYSYNIYYIVRSMFSFEKCEIHLFSLQNINKIRNCFFSVVVLLLMAVGPLVVVYVVVVMQQLFGVFFFI